MPKFLRLSNLAINIENVTKINIEKDHVTIEFIGGKDIKLHQHEQLERVIKTIERYAAGIED